MLPKPTATDPPRDNSPTMHSRQNQTTKKNIHILDRSGFLAVITQGKEEGDLFMYQINGLINYDSFCRADSGSSRVC